MQSIPDLALPLDPLSPRLALDEPFTTAAAAAAGIGRTVLDRLHRQGRVRRLLRGVYADATVPDSLQLRARAVGLVVTKGHVVTGRTAAWLHGIDAWREDLDAPVPVDVRGRGRGNRERLAGHDVEEVDGLMRTTALRTALDLGRLLGPDRALAVLDAALALRAFPHVALMAELARFGGRPGVGQLRELAALADSRADGPAESVLRRRWHHGRLPTPTPGLVVAGLAVTRPLRLALGLEAQRFGAVIGGQVSEADRLTVVRSGWRVLSLATARVVHGEPEMLTAHLEREFHLHLLDQVG